MEKRHAKVDVCGEVIQKGGRCQSTSGGRATSAVSLSGRNRLSGSSFRSIKSGQFREIQLQESAHEQSNMRGKIVPADTYKVLNETGCSKMAAAYDNEGLELEEGANPVAKCSKLSVSSAASYGLVMEGSRSQRNAIGERIEPNRGDSEVPVEAQKYALPDCEAASIHVKEAAAKTLTYNVIETAAGVHKSVQGEKNLVESTEMKEIRSAQAAEGTESTENTKTATGEEATLKRSLTVETNSSYPSTSYTFDSSLRPSTSFYDSQRDETLLIGDQDHGGSSTISQTGTSDLGLPPQEFEVPPGMSSSSFKTYQLIQQEGFKPGRCMLIIVVIITFCVTMVLAVLILIMPQSFKEKTDGSESSLLERTTSSPGSWPMHSRSLVKGIVPLQRIDDAHRIADTLQRLLAANVSMDSLDTNS